MVVDTLSIITMHTLNDGLQQLPRDGRRAYIQSLLNGSHPDMCIIPGDSDDVYTTVINGYHQHLVSGQKTIILYKPQKMRLSSMKVNPKNFSFLERISFEQMNCVNVEVLSPKPAQTVVKTFSMVTWEEAMVLRETTDAGRKKQAEDLVRFCQLQTLMTSSPVFVPGNFRQPHSVIQPVVNNLNTQLEVDIEKDEQVTDDYKKYGFLPSMIHGNMRPLRQKFKLKVHECQGSSNTEHGNYFLASKELELGKAVWLDMEVVTGKKIYMEALRENKPVKTEMKLPQRPPKHIGG